MSVTLERALDMPIPLEVEQETFARLLPSLSKEEGKFAVIYKSDLLGTFDSYSDALTIGYERAGLDSFLVKRISTVESVSYFSREIDATCPT